MADEQITAANIAKELGASPAKVKKAIDELKIQPVAKKGVCSYYSREAVKKIKGALKEGVGGGGAQNSCGSFAISSAVKTGPSLQT
jgi:hypothetical protein